MLSRRYPNGAFVLPTIRLTQAAVERVKPPAKGRTLFWDNHLPGLGMMVTETGAKSWKAMYRVNGRAVMETLGTLAQIPKVDDARDLARESMLKARRGVNPVAERRQAREEAAA